jgi:hypothetical protein
VIEMAPTIEGALGRVEPALPGPVLLLALLVLEFLAATLVLRGRRTSGYVAFLSGLAGLFLAEGFWSRLHLTVLDAGHVLQGFEGATHVGVGQVLAVTADAYGGTTFLWAMVGALLVGGFAAMWLVPRGTRAEHRLPEAP